MRGVGLSLIVGIDSKTEEIVATIKDDDGCSLGVGDVKSLLVLGKYKERVVGSGCNVLVGLSLIVGIDSKTEEIVATIEDDNGCSLGVGDVKRLLVLGKYKEKVVGSGCNVLVGLSLIVGIDSKTEEIVATIKDDDGCSLGVGDVKSLLVLGKYKEKVVGSGCNVLNGRSMGTSDVVMLAVLLTDMNIFLVSDSSRDPDGVEADTVTGVGFKGWLDSVPTEEDDTLKDGVGETTGVDRASIELERTGTDTTMVVDGDAVVIAESPADVVSGITTSLDSI